MQILSFWVWAVSLFAVVKAPLAAQPELRPRHDPADQLFRRAPMAQSARSVVVNLSTNLHYAFDSELNRIHTIWKGAPLNLWGPPYSYAKAPFICDFQGEVLFSFPQVSPWFFGSQPVVTRFRSIETATNEAVFSYDVLSPRSPVRIRERLRGVAEKNNWRLQRILEFPTGAPENLSFAVCAEAGAQAKAIADAVQFSGTNGTVTIQAHCSQHPVRWNISAESVSYESGLITEEQTEKGFVRKPYSGPETRVYASIPALTGPFSLEISLEHGSTIQSPAEPTPTHLPPTVWKGSGERRTKSGDASYQIESFPLPPESELLVTGMDWLRNGDLAVCTWLGEVYFVQNAQGNVQSATYKRFARGLNEPLGLAVHNGAIFVVQKGELTRITDSDGDGTADRFDCINNSWGYSGNYHSYSFGPLITDDNRFFVFVTGQRGLYDQPFQGWALEITPDGDQVTPFCSGLRVPHGWGFYGPQRDIFTTDNQGNWIGACRLNHLRQNRFYGFPSSRPASKEMHTANEVELPVLWFPRSLAPSSSGFDLAAKGFGPFQGQLFIGDFQNSIVMRACVEKVNEVWQGGVFPFAKGFLSGVNRVKMGPDGRLYVGGGKRTWSTAAPKEYSLERIAFTGTIPFEVQGVHATVEGFDLQLTQPADRESAQDPGSYLVKQFTYKYHQAYGSPEFDHHGKVGASELTVESATLSQDGKLIHLKIPALRTGFVTSFQLALSNQAGEDLRTDTFFYTLNQKPRQ